MLPSNFRKIQLNMRLKYSRFRIETLELYHLIRIYSFIVMLCKTEQNNVRLHHSNFCSKFCWVLLKLMSRIYPSVFWHFVKLRLFHVRVLQRDLLFSVHMYSFFVKSGTTCKAGAKTVCICANIVTFKTHIQVCH